MASPALVEQLYQALPDETKEFLNTAIANMQALNSYKVELLDLNVNYTGTGYTETGFVETITPDLISYRPYVVRQSASGSERYFTPNGDYGYKLMRDGLYNA